MTAHAPRLVAVMLFGVTSGCARETRAPDAPRQFVETRAETAPPKPPDEATGANVVIADDIRRACGITTSEAFFPYNSALVRDDERTVLNLLVECFVAGALAGRDMRLVGHADPRGDEEYNYLLGQRRADNVKIALASLGLQPARVLTTSRGEIDAIGSEEGTWAKDRRVDVLLGN